MRAFIKRRLENVLVMQIQIGMSFEDSFFQDSLCLCVGIEWLAFLDADRFQLIDHDLVPREPRFALHHAVQ